MKFKNFAVSALVSVLALSVSQAFAGSATTSGQEEAKIDGLTTTELGGTIKWDVFKSATKQETSISNLKFELTKTNTASKKDGYITLASWTTENLVSGANSAISLTNNILTANEASFNTIFGVYGRINDGKITATGNEVNVTGSTWTGSNIYAARALGASSKASEISLTGNSLHISKLTDSGTKSGTITSALASDAKKVNVSNNSTIIEDSSFKRYIFAFGAGINTSEIAQADKQKAAKTYESYSGTMSGNSLYISNTDFKAGAKIVGAADLDANASKNLTAENNSITLDNVKLAGKDNNIIGVQITKTENSSVKNTTVTLQNMSLDSSLNLRVAGANLSPTVHASGSTLNLIQTSGTIANVENFDKINVQYDFDKAAASTRTLDVGSAGSSDSKSSLITLSNITNQGTQGTGGDQAKAPKTSITVQVTGSHIDSNVNLLDVKGKDGENGSVSDVKVYANDFEVSQNKDGGYTFTEGNIKAQSQTATYAAPLAATAQLLNQGTDFMLAQPLTATGAFVVAGGGSDKFDVDHKSLKTEGASFMAGWASVMPHGTSTFTVAPFAEYGMGSYDATVDSTASGDLVYGGFGALVKWTHTTGAFVDASLRFGWTSGELNTTINSGSQVNDTAYSRYAAAHLRVGYRVPVIQSIGVTPYARYNYAHLQADMANNGLHFEGYTSSVLALGADVDGQLTENLTWKVGAAWERELEGQAAAQRYGLDLASWDLGSDSGVVNLQMSYQPANLPNVQFDITGQGRMGDHQGVTGRVGARYQF